MGTPTAFLSRGCSVASRVLGRWQDGAGVVEAGARSPGRRILRRGHEIGRSFGRASRGDMAMQQDFYRHLVDFGQQWLAFRQPIGRPSGGIGWLSPTENMQNARRVMPDSSRGHVLLSQVIALEEPPGPCFASNKDVSLVVRPMKFYHLSFVYNKVCPGPVLSCTDGLWIVHYLLIVRFLCCVSLPNYYAVLARSAELGHI